MSYNGSGVFQINSSGQPVVTGTVISSTAFNALTADLATGLSTAITKDGQTTTTARVPFAQGINSTLTTDATSTTTGSIITAGGISTQKALFVGTTSNFAGTMTAAAANFSGAITAAGTGATLAATVSMNANTTGEPAYIAAGGTDTNVGIDLNTKGTGSLRLNVNSAVAVTVANGNLVGIGMTPSNVLDITKNQNGASVIKLLNNSAGANAQALVQLSDGTNNAYMAFFGTGGVGTGPNNPGSFSIQTQATGGMNIATTAAYPMKFHINSAEVARFGSNGTFAIGTTDTTTYAVPLVIFKSGGSGTQFVAGGLSGQGISLFMNICGANGYNAGEACAIGGGYATVNNRSANFGGTVNASGADYAEYMTKADGCGAITKGSICGVDVTGELTDKFSNAHSFVIKSTNPSYVGGDTWGSSEILGDNPSLRGKSGKETDAAYRTRVTDFKTKAEAARQKVDRIAFSGQVPVNVIGATVGDYIVPVVGPDGGIAGEAVTNPTFDQYRAAVGRVWKILEDGRAFVSVKVS